MTSLMRVLNIFVTKSHLEAGVAEPETGRTSLPPCGALGSQGQPCPRPLCLSGRALHMDAGRHHAQPQQQPTWGRGIGPFLLPGLPWSLPL